HRAPGVKFLGADTDLGAEPELEAVVEPRRRVDEHGGRVDFLPEPLCPGEVGGDDRLAVPGAVKRYVLEGSVEAVYDAHRQLESQELGVVIECRYGLDVGTHGPGALATNDFDAGSLKVDKDLRQERRRHRLMYQQVLGCVAYARPLDLGVEDYGVRHGE